MIIQLNLDNLTQAMVDQALPNMGDCNYSSPCLIGAMMTHEQRAYLSEKGSDNCAVGQCDHIQFPDPEQARVATEIQRAFDRDNLDSLAELLPHLDFFTA